MAEKAKSNKEHYHQVRDEFDSLKIEEKAAFLVESTFSMLVHGIEAVGKVFSDQINKVYQEEKDEEPEEKKPKRASTARKTTRKRASSRTRKTTTPKKEE